MKIPMFTHREVVAGLLACGLGLACTPEPQPPPNNPDGVINNLSAAANDAAVQSPFDAVPSPDGSAVYYTALVDGEDGPEAGVFTVPATGGTPVTLTQGEPLSSAVGVDVSFDGETLFIADASALENDDGESGALFRLSVNGGTPEVIPGTEGRSPGGVVVQQVGGDEFAYFSGARGQVQGVYRVLVAGGAVETIVEGPVFEDLGGIAVSREGDVYVVDGRPSLVSAALYRIRDGSPTLLKEEIGVGFPAGVALSSGESVVLVSGIDPSAGTDVVYRIELASGATTTLSQGIDSFAESAGLHRAHNVEVYAWADSEADEHGTVFLLTP